MDDEIVIGINHPENEMPNKKRKKATKNVASKKSKKLDKKKKYKRKDKKKEKVERGNKYLFAIIFILCLIFAIVLLLFFPLFKIEKINVKNNSIVSKEEIEKLGSFDKYRTIFWVNNLKVSKDLKKNAYIEEIKVHKKIPNTIEIEVKERIPKFMLQIADSYIYIDGQGYFLGISTENIGLPIILGFKTDLSNVELGKRLDIDDLKRMDIIIKIMETATVHGIDNLITKIDISDEKNYTLILETEEKTVYLGEATELNTRMIYLSGILSREKGVAGEIFLNMNLNTEDAFFREKI